MTRKYDIFISYRRQDCGDKAEHLKDLLEPKFRNRISFDRENLTGLFDVSLIDRIDHCRDFLLIAGKKTFIFSDEDFSPEQTELYAYLAQCPREEFARKIVELGHDARLDFMRIEVARALRCKGLNIIPIVPESTDGFSFGRLRLPPDIAGIKRYEAVFYSDNPDALFKNIMPKLFPLIVSPQDTLWGKTFVVSVSLLLLSAVIVGALSLAGHLNEREKQRLMVETALDGKYLNWSSNITLEQVQAVNEILADMVKVEGGTFMMGAARNPDEAYDDEVCIGLETPQRQCAVESFWMSKYEMSIGRWCRIMGEHYEEADADMPKTDVSYEECEDFVTKLADLTGLDFRIPSEAEWEYAARGGAVPDETRYAGSDCPDQVAWHAGNSGGMPHECNAEHSPMYCNGLNIYDMSGNVSEWCSTGFAPYSADIPVPDKESKVIRGGNYDSETYELTVYHRDPMNVRDKAETVGLRLIIKN